MKKRVKRTFKIERGGGNGEAPESSDAFSALAGVLDTKPEGLAETYDFLRLFGAVVGQIALLNVAAECSDPKAQASAGRALISCLKEKPEHIAERLRSSKFNSLNTEDLQTIVAEISSGKNPKQALQDHLDEKKA